MPIRFRCTACGGVLSIARRKAGASILCPKCAVSVVVPGASTVPDPEEPAPAVRSAVAGEPVIAGRPAGPNGTKPKKAGAKPPDDLPLFERLDFESLLQPAAAKAKDGSASKPVAVAAPPKAAPPSAPPAAPKPERFPARTDPKPKRERPESAPAVIRITRIQLAAIVILIFCLVGMGVGVGYALGRP